MRSDVWPRHTGYAETLTPLPKLLHGIRRPRTVYASIRISTHATCTRCVCVHAALHRTPYTTTTTTHPTTHTHCPQRPPPPKSSARYDRLEISEPGIRVPPLSLLCSGRRRPGARVFPASALPSHPRVPSESPQSLSNASILQRQPCRPAPALSPQLSTPASSSSATPRTAATAAATPSSDTSRCVTARSHPPAAPKRHRVSRLRPLRLQAGARGRPAEGP